MQLYELFYPQLAEAVFCEQIRRVDFASDLPDINTSEAHCLLNPQLLDVEVSNIPRPGGGLLLAHPTRLPSARASANLQTHRPDAEC